MCFEMATTNKGLLESYTGVRYGITENTDRSFICKVREAMKTGNNPIDRWVNMDDFVERVK